LRQRHRGAAEQEGKNPLSGSEKKGFGGHKNNKHPKKKNPYSVGVEAVRKKKKKNTKGPVLENRRKSKKEKKETGEEMSKSAEI